MNDIRWETADHWRKADYRLGDYDLEARKLLKQSIKGYFHRRDFELYRIHRTVYVRGKAQVKTAICWFVEGVMVSIKGDAGKRAVHHILTAK